MYTVYDEDKNSFIQVEEPDSSLNYTYADYLKWKFEERLELIKGKIFKMSPASNLRHQEVSGKIFVSLSNFLEEKPCKVFSAPFDVRLPVRNRKKDGEITTVVQPDICVICDESKLDERGCCGAPDIVVEILSPGNSQKEVRIKFELYEESGVKEYWIVNPAEQNISAFVLVDGKFKTGRMLANGDSLKSHAVHGFIASVSKIFSK